MIHAPNILPEEYGIVLEGFENHLTVTGDDALTIDSIHKKLNQRLQKNNSKKEEKIKKEKAWVA